MKITEKQIRRLIIESLNQRMLLNEVAPLLILGAKAAVPLVTMMASMYALEKGGGHLMEKEKEAAIKEYLNNEKIEEYQDMPKQIDDILVYAKRLKRKGKIVKSKGEKKKGNDFITLGRKLEKGLSSLEDDYLKLMSIIKSDFDAMDPSDLEKTAIGQEAAFGAVATKNYVKHYASRAGRQIKKGAGHFMGAAGKGFNATALVYTVIDLVSQMNDILGGMEELEQIVVNRDLFLRSKLIKRLHEALSKDKNEKGYFKLPEEPDINSVAGIKINSLNVN